MEWKSARPNLAEIARRLSVTRTAVSRWAPQARAAGVRRSPLESAAALRAPLLLGLALLLTFAPYFLVSYIKDDDYLFSLFAKSDPPALYASQAYTGRLLNGILLYETLPRVDDIGSFRFIRLIGLAGLFWLGVRLYKELRRQRATRATAIWLAYTLCVLPAFSAYLSLVNSAFYLAAAAIGAEAGCLAWRVATEPHGRRGLLLGLSGVVLFLIAGLIYESAAMVYWVIVAIQFIAYQPPAKVQLRRFGWLLGIAVLGSLAILLVHAWSGANQNEHGALTTDLAAKLVWFLGDPMRDALNMIVVPSTQPVALVAGVIIFVGVWLRLHGTLGQRVFYLGVLGALLPLSFVPHILAAHHWATYRTEIGLTAIVVLYAGYAVQGYARVLRKLIGHRGRYLPLVVVPAFAVVAGFIAARNALLNVAMPSFIEFSYLKGQITNANLADVDTIYLIHPAWEDSCAAEVTQDFGEMTSYWDWAVIPFTQAGLREAGLDESQFRIVPIRPGEPIGPPHRSLTINMGKLSSYC